jgi:hypothetical protein
VEESRRSFSAILSVSAMALILALAAQAYRQFVHVVENPPAPKAEPPAPNLAPVIWPEVARDLEGAVSLTVYSLSPGWISHETWASEEWKGKPSFHDYWVLGSAPVRSAKRVRPIVSHLTRGVRTEGSPMGCFNPRHGVRATLRDGRQIDLVICYSCDRIDVYGAREEILVHPGPSRETLDDVLRSAGIDLNDPRLLPFLGAPGAS